MVGKAVNKVYIPFKFNYSNNLGNGHIFILWYTTNQGYI